MNDVRREKYQVMPALPAEDYEALKADIAARNSPTAASSDRDPVVVRKRRRSIKSSPFAILNQVRSFR